MSDSKTVAQSEVKQLLGELKNEDIPSDVDPAETSEWLGSLEYVLKTRGPERIRFLLDQLRDRAAERARRLDCAGNRCLA